MNQSRPRICLNGIVRNESRTITRLLDSLAGHVDEYVLVDTGSEDDTVALIEHHPIPGVVKHRAFDNFGKARTHALQMALKHATAEWVLLMDADMMLCGSFDGLPSGDADVFSIIQVQGGLRYKNVRLIRRALLASVTCVGPTHEYYDFPPTVRQGVYAGAWIEDRGDGGHKADKFTRDLALLEKQRPRNARCTFYLAETHLALNNIDEALKFYLKRIKMGGFELEVDYARHRALVCYLRKSDLTSAQKLFTGSREDALAITTFLRERGDNVGAWTFVTKGIAAAPKDVLFYDLSVEAKLRFERTVLWYYISPDMPDVGLRLSMKFLDDYPSIDADLRRAVMNNTRFYVRPLVGELRSDGWVMEQPWHTSTPSYPGGLVRAVNYSIDRDTGRYMVDGPVRSRLFRGNGAEVTVHVGEGIPEDPNAGCLGVEDVRLGYDGRALCSSLQYTHTPGVVSQVVGVLREDGLWLDHVVPARTHEKNWVFAGEVVVYDWYPRIRIGVPTPDGFVITKTVESVPHSFQNMRGSSSGVLMGDEWVFVTHVALDAPDKRYYTHRLVVLDNGMTRVVRSSLPFLFTGRHAVEFCMGLEAVSPTMLRIGCSEGDNTTRSILVNITSFFWV